MERSIIVRRMQSGDLDFAAQCTANEGWSTETRTEFEGFLTHAPDGCLVAEIGGQRVGICVATPYGEAGFIGELIVAQEWRGRGIGRQLMARAIGYLRDQGAQSIYLDGVTRAVPLYERLGFRKIGRSMRFTGAIPGRSHPPVRAMKAGDLPAVRRLDHVAFGADRSFFLERRFELYPELCWVLEQDGKVAGFILGRRGNGWATAGPWVVHPDVEHPERLLDAFATATEGVTLGVGVLETNAAAVEILRSYGLTENQTPPWRMVLGRTMHVGTSNQLYAIGSAAKG